jgi:hypothetical protein
MFASSYDGRSIHSSYVGVKYEHKRGQKDILYYGQVQYYFEHYPRLRMKKMERIRTVTVQHSNKKKIKSSSFES